MKCALRLFGLIGFCSGVTVWGADVDMTVVLDMGVPNPTVQKAMIQVRGMLQEAGVRLRWTTAPNTHTLVKALVRRTAGDSRSPCGAAWSITARILTTAPQGHTRKSLGYSTPFTSSGNITVFQPQVNAVAQSHGLQPAVVLAHVLAHELGHVLQGSVEHSAHGLMAASWEGKAFEMMTRVSLRFSPGQIRSMEHNAKVERCGLVAESGG